MMRSDWAKKFDRVSRGVGNARPHRWARQGMAAMLLMSLWISSGCRAEQPWPLWENYAGKFLDTQGRVIDHSAGDISTTEGEAYAMFFALVANDQSRFNKLVEWTEANMAQGDLTLHLPAWSWGKAPDGSWKVLDANPAADADLWMAYSLEEAGRLWGNERYKSLGKIMADRVAQQEIVLVPGLGTTLIPGAQGFHPDPVTWYVNPSYMPPQLLAFFQKENPGPWGEVAASLPAVVSSQGGFVMDWLNAGSNGVHPMPPPSTVGNGKAAPTPVGSYDAIRMYLWMGIADPRTPGVKESLRNMMGMANYLDKNVTPPEQVDSTGKVVSGAAPVGFSAAVIPYLHALKRSKDEGVQQDRLNATTREPKTGLYGSGGLYYDQVLVMFESGWAEHRYAFDASGRLQVKWKN